MTGKISGPFPRIRKVDSTWYALWNPWHASPAQVVHVQRVRGHSSLFHRSIATIFYSIVHMLLRLYPSRLSPISKHLAKVLKLHIPSLEFFRPQTSVHVPRVNHPLILYVHPQIDTVHRQDL